MWVKNTQKVFEDFKNKQKSIWSNVFWYVKVYIFWNFIQFSIHWDKSQMLKKLPSDKIDVPKKALSFLSRAATRHSSFISRFLYELKHKFRLSKSMSGIFHSRFCFVFVRVYIFIQPWTYNWEGLTTYQSF